MNITQRLSAAASLSRFIRTSLALMFSTVATSLLGMVFWAVAARMFDTAAVGTASAGASAMLLLGGLGQLALTSVFARVLPTAGTSTARLIAGGYAVMSAAAIVLTAVFVVADLGHGFLDYRPWPVIGFGIAVAATAASAVQDGVLVAVRRASWVPMKNTVLSVAKLVLLPVLAATGSPAPILIAWTAPVAISVLVINVALFGHVIPRTVATDAAPDLPHRPELVRLVGGQYANSIINGLILFLPPVLVTLVLGAHANAVFYLPWMIGTAIIGLLWNIVVPFVVEATADPAKTRLHLRQALRLGLLLTVGGGAGLLVTAPYALAIAGGDYSADGTGALRLIAIALPFAGIMTFFGAAELMEKRAWKALWTRAVSAAIFLGSAVPCMKAFGVNGAAAAFTAAQVIVGIALLPSVISRYRALIVRAENAMPAAPVPRRVPVAAATSQDAVS